MLQGEFESIQYIIFSNLRISHKSIIHDNMYTNKYAFPTGSVYEKKAAETPSFSAS